MILCIHIGHYLIVDDRFTWWDCGRSYLCRIIDMLHMGLLDEAVFGREVLTRLPVVVPPWVDVAWRREAGEKVDLFTWATRKPGAAASMDRFESPTGPVTLGARAHRRDVVVRRCQLGGQRLGAPRCDQPAAFTGERRVCPQSRDWGQRGRRTPS